MEDQGRNSFDASQFFTVGKLGSGCQADVFEVEHQASRQRFALKVIKTTNLTEKEKGRAQFEVKSNMFITNQVHSCHFPKMHAFWTTPNALNILFERCEQNAQTGYKRLASYSQRYSYVLVLLFDMLMALHQLQKMGIIHRDVKPQNILLTHGMFKLADLGLSRLSDNTVQFTNDIGNRLGRSPEFNTGKYDSKTDVWSLGVHIFYLLQGTLPFDDDSLLRISNNPNEIEKVICSTDLKVQLQSRGRRSKNVLSFVHMVLSEMIVIDTDNRRSASQILASFFGCCQSEVNPMKNLFLLYLQKRQFFGDIFMILLLAYNEFYRMDGKVRSEIQSNKQKICLKVKVVVYQLVHFIQRRLDSTGCEECWTAHLHQLLRRWDKQLGTEIDISQVPELSEADEALEIYNIQKVRQKFPLIEWIVKIYKSVIYRLSGNRTNTVQVWKIPLELNKVI